jgi:hypothetical protein
MRCREGDFRISTENHKRFKVGIDFRNDLLDCVGTNFRQVLQLFDELIPNDDDPEA